MRAPAIRAQALVSATTLSFIFIFIFIFVIAAAGCGDPSLKNIDEDVRVTPGTLLFGEVPMGTIARRAVRIDNLSRRAISGSVAVDAPFQLSSSSELELPAGSSATVEVSVTPSQPGELSGALTIESDAGTVTVPLRASVTPAVDCPARLCGPERARRAGKDVPLRHERERA